MIQFKVNAVQTNAEIFKGGIQTPKKNYSFVLYSQENETTGYKYVDVSDVTTRVWTKGSMVLVSMSSASIAVNEHSSLPYSDYDSSNAVLISLGAYKSTFYVKIHTRAVNPLSYTMNITQMSLNDGTLSILTSTNACSNTSLSASVSVELFSTTTMTSTESSTSTESTTTPIVTVNLITTTTTTTTTATSSVQSSFPCSTTCGNLELLFIRSIEANIEF